MAPLAYKEEGVGLEMSSVSAGRLVKLDTSCSFGLEETLDRLG
jgi:hypothetical protein